ncbi:MAG: MerR family transcriptional regulator [Labilithrix sp.]
MSRKNQRRPEGYVTRAELARAAKKGKTTIRRWEEEGKIKPIIGPGGVRLFRVEDVKRLTGVESIEPLARARAYVPTADTADGAIGAAVFERLSQNMPPVQIVTDLKNVHPDIIAGFIARYERMSGGMFFDERQRRTLCILLQIRRDADAATIFQKVSEMAQERTCRSCQDAVAHHCNDCKEAYAQQSADAAAHWTARRMAAQHAADGRRDDRHRSRDRDAWSEDAVMQNEPDASRRYEQENVAIHRRRTPQTREAQPAPSTASATHDTKLADESDGQPDTIATSADKSTAKTQAVSEAYARREERGRARNEPFPQQAPFAWTPDEVQRWPEMMKERLQADATPPSSNGDPNETPRLSQTLEPEPVETRNTTFPGADMEPVVGGTNRKGLEVGDAPAPEVGIAQSDGGTRPTTGAREPLVTNDLAASVEHARTEQQHADDGRQLERSMYEQARNGAAARPLPPEMWPVGVAHARARASESGQGPRTAAPFRRSEPASAGGAATPAGHAASAPQKARVAALASGTAAASIGAHGDHLFDGVPPELIASFERLTAKDAPIPDDPKEIEAWIREFDRIQAAIAEHLRARSSVPEPAIPS